MKKIILYTSFIVYVFFLFPYSITMANEEATYDVVHKTDIYEIRHYADRLIVQAPLNSRDGENSKICFCGDATQSDLTKTNDRNGIVDFMNILRKMVSFDIIEFDVNDIVRSGLVKEYIVAKLQSGM